jgi:hypothetical protein
MSVEFITPNAKFNYQDGGALVLMTSLYILVAPVIEVMLPKVQIKRDDDSKTSIKGQNTPKCLWFFTNMPADIGKEILEFLPVVTSFRNIGNVFAMFAFN